MFLKEITQKALTLLLSISLMIGGMYFYEFNPLNWSIYGVWGVSSTLFISAFIILLQEVIYSVSYEMTKKTSKIHKQLEEIRNTFRSTVKTLTFITGSDKRKINLGLSSKKVKSSEKVAEGSVKMRVVSSFLDTLSTLVVVEGSTGSRFGSHSHSEIVSLFVVEGSMEIDITRKNGNMDSFSVGKGEAITIDPFVERKIKFKNNCVAVMVFTPPLEDFVDSKDKMNRDLSNVRVEEGEEAGEGEDDSA